jgi:mRNA-degrading endonuclease RelE of RelBE toxin-antitoxin system
MDKISKALKRFSFAELKQVRKILEVLSSESTKGLDIKKLKGRDDIYRVRKGQFRIIYRKYKNKIYLLAIERRNERTYKDI